MRIWTFIFSGLLSFAVQAQVPACPACSVDAAFITSQLASLKFNCAFSPVSSQRGFRCRGLVAGYSRPVNIYIAPTLQRDREVTLAYHFHGWTGDQAPRITFDYPDGDFAAWMAASGKNAVLMVPESLGQNQTYADDLGTPAKMTNFLNTVETLLSHAGLTTTLSTPRLISGHSGAYVQMGLMGDWATSGAVPALKSLRGIGMFDTNYGYRPGLVTLMDVECRNPSATYFMVFNPNDGSTGKRDTNKRIYDEVTKQHACAKAKVIYTPDPGTVHVQFPSKYMAKFLAAAIP